MSKKRLFAPFASDFFFLAIALFLIYFPQWNPYRYPQHDTLFYFNSFYAFYNNFYYNFELAHWFPYGLYGIQANYWQLMNLAPTAYWSGILGSLFRIKDVLFLFKFSIFLDLLIFSSGMLLLGLQLFRSRSTAFLCALIASATTVWYTQIDWNFRVYYLLPYSFYFLNKYALEKKAYWFWWAVIVMLISVVGNIVYVMAMNLFIFLIHFGFCSAVNRCSIRNLLQKDKASITAAIIFASISVLLIFFMSSFFREVSSFMHGRIQGQLGVTLENFLTYGPRIGLEKFKNIFYTGIEELQEQTFYCGAGAVMLVMLSLIRVRLKSFYFWIALLFFLVLFSIGKSGVVADLMYKFFFPMKFYRYIGHVGGWFRLFFALAAGYGFCAWLSMSKLRLRSKVEFLIFWSTLLALAIVWVLPRIEASPISDPDTIFFLISFFLGGSVIILGIFIKTMSTRFKKILLIGFVLIELFGYQQITFSNWAPWPNIPRESVMVRRDYFKPFRVFNYAELDPEQVPAMKLMEIAFIRANQEFYNYSMIDSCVTMDPSIQVSSRVQRLTETIFDSTAPALSLLTDRAVLANQPNAPIFLTVSACHNPKLFLTSDVVYASNAKDAQNAMVKPLSGFGRVILEEVQDLGIYESKNITRHFLDADHFRINHFSFNQLDVNATASAGGPVWLYYADAYHPGWHVKIDGKSVQVVLANIAFKAVQVPPGTHRVKFYFFDGWYSAASIAIAILSLIMAVLWLYYLVVANHEN